MLLEHLVHRGVEEVLLGREVVVEGAEAHVGGVGDLLDADLGGIPGAQQVAGGGDEGGAGLRLPSFESAGREGGIGHLLSLEAASVLMIVAD